LDFSHVQQSDRDKPASRRRWPELGAVWGPGRPHGCVSGDGRDGTTTFAFLCLTGSKRTATKRPTLSLSGRRGWPTTNSSWFCQARHNQPRTHARLGYSFHVWCGVVWCAAALSRFHSPTTTRTDRSSVHRCTLCS
jgi:hypothetical protein